MESSGEREGNTKDPVDTVLSGNAKSFHGHVSDRLMGWNQDPAGKKEAKGWRERPGCWKDHVYQYHTYQ